MEGRPARLQREWLAGASQFGRSHYLCSSPEKHLDTENPVAVGFPMKVDLMGQGCGSSWIQRGAMPSLDAAYRPPFIVIFVRIDPSHVVPAIFSERPLGAWMKAPQPKPRSFPSSTVRATRFTNRQHLRLRFRGSCDFSPGVCPPRSCDRAATAEEGSALWGSRSHAEFQRSAGDFPLGSWTSVRKEMSS
jgi:hypothetical protein